jgi:hypothetical protein
MSLTIEDWKKGLEAYANLKKQAEIDTAMTAVVYEAIERKIRELEEAQEVKDGE